MVARKSGPAEAAEATRRAAQVLVLGWDGGQGPWEVLQGFDAWLREEGHTRNPGTTADLVAAGLFALLRQYRLTPLTAARHWAAPGFDLRRCRIER